MKDVDDEVREEFISYKATIEATAGKTFDSLEPVKYTQQVVAGMNYHIKYRVSDGSHIHVKVFKPLPHTGAPAECNHFSEGHGADEPFTV